MGVILLTYEELLIEADTQNLIVKEKKIPGFSGRIYKNRIAIHSELPTQTEKSCVLAEELGHYYTTVGDILDMNDSNNQKQELRARFYAYNLQIGLSGLITAAKAGCRNRYEIAEYLGVTEEFLKEAIECYTGKYGTGTLVDNYWIAFEPNFQVYEYKICSHNCKAKKGSEAL